ncbi:ribosomal maturation YjgA family protein [Pseudochryseolinea flava]|uniref:DUF2809 domain-containing protein n=1 Tax=Pseudochryseolinea flava TaxID=2059302 RepID=A0A364Y5T9_9BACT|nr:DUF2809 domain-containing protein [Pseudochryseolinea flava]RAW02239.1 DUF2809 domain-containing protein [Pseudochryseolinea flava]
MTIKAAAARITFNRNYFYIAALIFVVELLIACFVRDRIIRPYVGDVLVVILVYCFVKSLFNLPVVPVAIGVCIFAFTVEYLQYINIVEKLGLQKNELARIAIGTLFEWIDLLAYTFGTLIILIVETWNKKNK